jgi:hypothetical protein
MMDFILLKIFKGIGGFQGYGFGFWHSSNIGCFGFLDLIFQAFIEYWWFRISGFGSSGIH